MEEKDFKRFMIPITIALLAVLAFMIVRPIFIPIILGMLFAYLFYPLFKIIARKVKSDTISGFIIVVGVFLIILIPFLLLMPLLIKQIFEVYLTVKNTDLSNIVFKLIPSVAANTAMSTELIAAVSHFNANLSTMILSLFQNTIMNIPGIIFGIVILLFTFYFSLKEGHNVRDYFSTLFPFPKEFQERFFQKFDQVTNSVIYGHIIIGIAQGAIAGVGYYMFGLPNALLLTVATTLIGVIPVIGPWLVWMPADLLLFLNGSTTQGIQLLIYGLLVINWVETMLRPQIIAKQADMNPAIALIGAIGGTYAFGLIGFFVGPLLLAYLILLIELYKNKKSEDSIVLREVKEVKEEKKE